MQNDSLSPIRIEPDGLYDDGTLRLLLGLACGTTARARREGSLRFSRRGNRTLYKGAWILAWIEGARTGEPGVEVPR
jgi:hypothetical protein